MTSPNKRITRSTNRKQYERQSAVSMSQLSNEKQQQQEQQEPTEQRPPIWKVWFIASRPHTLTASISPIIVSYNVGLVVIQNLNLPKFRFLTFEWMIFCILMQVGTNLHNDYADFVKGS